MLTDPPQPPTSFGPAFLCSLSSFACSRTGDGSGDTAPSEGSGDTASAGGIDSDSIKNLCKSTTVIGF